MKEEKAISISGVSKNFRLPHQKSTTVKSMFAGLLAGKNGQEITAQHALQDISFEVKKGEFFGIVGRNGSGKSTLLKILAGIYQPTTGHVKRTGRLVPFIELGVGFNPELTGRENVYLNGALLGFSEVEVADMYDDVVEFAELERFMDQQLKNYSSGMQVRLAFSMAIRAQADILLIDEVLAVGDADFQRKCFDYFNQLKKKGATVVFVSHDMEAVRKYCDRALLIENSRILMAGKTNDVAEAYLRLFTETNSEEKADDGKVQKGNRWGDGSAVTKDLTIKITDELIVINQVIEVTGSILNPIIGFRIRNDNGVEMTGTNTLIERVDTSHIKNKGIFKVTWSFENMFAEDTYTLDPSILRDDGISAADWWNGAATFKIQRKRRLPYVIQPRFTVKTSK